MPSATHLSDPVIPISIAVLGIGLMGYPMARRLCEAGHRVTAWNRSRAKAERLEPFGARVCDTPAQAVAQADFVITLLENGDVVEDVLFRQGGTEGLRPGRRPRPGGHGPFRPVR
jgi:2-hydroxy-3-oxopropionate reductase